MGRERGADVDLKQQKPMSLILLKVESILYGVRGGFSHIIRKYVRRYKQYRRSGTGARGERGEKRLILSNFPSGI